MNISAEAVRELRERSGESMMSCKAALVAHGGDRAGALEHLRCEGQAVYRKGPNARRPCGCLVRQ